MEDAVTCEYLLLLRSHEPLFAYRAQSTDGTSKVTKRKAFRKTGRKEHEERP